MPIKVAINGFGRIGRLVLRNGIGRDNLEFVAVNDIAKASMLAHLFKYDSVHGAFDGEVKADDNSFTINGKKIQVLGEKEPANLPWKALEVDVVIESTGLFREREKAEKHITAGAKKVLISAPGKDVDLMVVIGVNEKLYNKDEHHIISNASCTTNCLAPVVKILHERFKIKNGLMTTIHSYTADQNLQDGPHKKDIRRARAAAVSMVPTSTGAAKAVGKIIPELQGKLDGIAIRVPTPNVSIVDLACVLETATTTKDVNKVFQEAAEGELKGILHYTEEPLVSVDHNGSHFSSIVDAELTEVMEGTFVKIFSWYDNEMGYATRLTDLIEYVMK